MGCPIKSSHRVVLCTLLAIAGCTSAPGKDFFTETIDSLHARNSPLRAGYTGTGAVTSAAGQAQRFNGTQFQGSGQFVSSGAPVTRVTTDGSGQFELNLVNAPIAEAAKAVLGDALHLNYIVDPRVQGTVTLQTSQPVSKDALVDILQSALAVNGCRHHQPRRHLPDRAAFRNHVQHAAGQRAVNFTVRPRRQGAGAAAAIHRRRRNEDHSGTDHPPGLGAAGRFHPQPDHRRRQRQRPQCHPRSGFGVRRRLDAWHVGGAASAKNLQTGSGCRRTRFDLRHQGWTGRQAHPVHPQRQAEFGAGDHLAPGLSQPRGDLDQQARQAGRDQRRPAFRLPDPEPPGQGTGRGAEFRSRHRGQDRRRLGRLECVARPDADRHAIGWRHAGAIDRAVAFAAQRRTDSRPPTPRSSPISKTTRC